MLGLLSAGFPHKALALMLAVVVTATALVVAPIHGGASLVGIGEEVADAHVQWSCRYETRWVTQPDGNRRPVHSKVCNTVSHSHRPPAWQRYLRIVGTNLACGGFAASVGGAVAYGTKSGQAGASIGGSVYTGCTASINRIGN